MENAGYLTNLPLDEAMEAYLKALENGGMKRRIERVRTRDACGRITAKALYALLSSPHYVASAMDGVAVRAQDTFSASEAAPVVLPAYSYVRVDTGDPLPEGCDGVIMIEDVVPAGDGGIRITAPAAPWQHVRQIGEDVSAGDMLLPSYTEITPAAAGAMLAGGVLEAEVLSKPRVCILPTGDEVVPPTASPRPGEVMEFNSTIFSGMLKAWGAEPILCPIVPDEPELLRAALAKALETADAALVIAGTSAGRDDGTAAAIRALGEVVVHGVAIRPGKPAVLGVVKGCPVLGVPGYPVSGILVLEQIFKPVLDALLMRDPGEAPMETVTLSARLNSSLKYREFIRATLGAGPDGALTATPLNRGAGVVTSFVKADCILDIPQDAEVMERGESVQARLMRPIGRIQRTVRIVGSHDPLIDEAADLLRRRDRRLYVSSAHVGSMGGIRAVAAGQAHLAGVHLLDEDTGEYNISYIKRFIPQGGVVLLGCVRRTQGLMVAKGNPKGISGFPDIARQDVSYVNRQRGAGTRVLCDYLLKNNAIAPAHVSGYTREETTHTAVAAQIAAESADCGLGILSAARMYDLDFIPVCGEEYDLLASLDALELPQVKAFLEILAGPELAARLEALGGYELCRPGQTLFEAKRA